jgi:pilus assembly protein CpaB
LKKRTGCIWIVTGVVLALLAGALAFYAIMRASVTPTKPVLPETPKVKVVVASRAIAIRELLQAGDVETRSAPADVVPDNVVGSTEEAVGWMVAVPLSPGEMILASQLISPTIKGEALALTMDKSKVAMAYPADDLMTRNNLLKPGDRVDLLFSIEVPVPDKDTGELVTFNALQNLEIAALVHPRDLESKAKAGAGVTGAQPLAIVFALDPQDALVLKYLKDKGGSIDIVLRAPEAKERFSTRPVHMDYLSDRFQLRVPVEP